MFIEYTKVLRSLTIGIAMTLMIVGINVSSAKASNVLCDYTGDNRTDFVVLRINRQSTSPIIWRVARNPASPEPNQAFIRQFEYGSNATDNIVRCGDYGAGDSKADPTVYRLSATDPGLYLVGLFPEGINGINLARAVRWGIGTGSDRTGAEGDYDGDGKLDFTVVRTVNQRLIWYWMSSATNTMRGVEFGSIAGLPPSAGFDTFRGADFNGDGRDEFVLITRTTAGTVTYYAGDSMNGVGVRTQRFGSYNDDISMPPIDMTGDGRADYIAVRETDGATATFYIQNSVTSEVTSTSFGIADPTFANIDQPIQGDYDGDGINDIAVYRPGNATFYWVRSIDGLFGSQQFGQVGDFPLASDGF